MKPLTTDELATIASNRAMCLLVLLRRDDPRENGLEPLRRYSLSDTPYSVLEALAWAYGRIFEELEGRTGK